MVNSCQISAHEIMMEIQFEVNANGIHIDEGCKSFYIIGHSIPETWKQFLIAMFHLNKLLNEYIQ